MLVKDNLYSNGVVKKDSIAGMLGNKQKIEDKITGVNKNFTEESIKGSSCGCGSGIVLKQV
ncbi:MAG: hypothetical protein N2169_05005 [bacterium]|nr:hypothetical protein [bacterium]